MLPRLDIRKMEIPQGRRLLVTSDIHGYCHHLEQLLAKAEFTENDILVIIGDLIEKGPESLKTLRYIMWLCERGNVIPLLGNVDGWRLHTIVEMDSSTADEFVDNLLEWRDYYGTSFFDELTAELGFLCNTADEVLAARERIIDHFAAELSFIASLPTVLQTQNYSFVHGGLPESSLDNLDKHELFEFLKVDNFCGRGLRFEQYVVVGHWPVVLYSDDFPCANPLINNDQRIISIDGGCGTKIDCQLNLLVIPDIDCGIDEVSFVSYDDFPTVTALTAQEAGEHSCFIKWVDNRVSLLSRVDDFAEVEHLSTGTRLLVPVDFLFDNDSRIADYTDYALPVACGDKLSLIKQTSKGCIVKKNGVTGWYYGKME